MPDIFSLRNIEYAYIKGNAALTDININVAEGEILSIIGSNGSGKSTLLHLMCGLIFSHQGTLEFKGMPVHEKALKNNVFNTMFRSSIGYVFQNPDSQLFCPTVMDELVFGPLQSGISKNDAIIRAEQVIQMLNIECLSNRPTYMLSGGEKKRVAIGSVLTTNPEVLLFDEPMSGLDPKTRSFIIELIFRLNEAGKTIVIATHHLELVNHFQSRVVVLSEKHTIEKTGSCEEILSDTNLLISANLISEYPHKHENHIHRHLSTGFLFHEHK